MTNAVRRHSLTTASIALAVWICVPMGPGAQEPTPAPAPTPKPLVPVAAGTLARNPEPYYGEVVSVTAAVEQQLSQTAFSVKQDRAKGTGHDVLVLAPTLGAPVGPNTYVTVVGELVRFDPVEVALRAKTTTLDLGPDVIARYQGRPAILATAVVTSRMVDLARRAPPPMTPEEEAYDKVMKRVGPAFNTLRTALTGSDAAATAESTKMLRTAFGEAEAFWTLRAVADALEWTRAARKHVDAIERAASAGNWDAIKSSTTELGQVCQTCHSSYRERLDDGTYRLRAAK